MRVFQPRSVRRGLESQELTSRCVQVPGDSCWPSESEWGALNSTVEGALFPNQPIAVSCYPGSALDGDKCAAVNDVWGSPDFQTSHPVGRSYPHNHTCPPVDVEAGEEPVGTCSLGPLPTYTINATQPDHVDAALSFAREHNLRITIAGTGHDMLGRSDGYGALQIWLRHYRHGITYQPTYTPSDPNCSESGWEGGALKIDGSYQWRDVAAVASENNAIVVTGSCVTTGAIGAWASGGGHGPASRAYGLGADQLLEAEVMLADGRIITVNHCQNTDLFRAMRGGGPGFGVTLSSTVKAYPDVESVTVQTLSIAPLDETPENADLLDAVTVLLQSFPDLNRAGYGGTGRWFRKSPVPVVNNVTSGYRHNIWAIGADEEEAKKAWAPVSSQLAEFKDRLFINETFATYPDYWTFFDAVALNKDTVGTTLVGTSRLVPRSAVSNTQSVRDMVEIVSGEPEEYIANMFLIVSADDESPEPKDAASGLHPAWSNTSFALMTSRSIPAHITVAERDAIQEDMTFVKEAAVKKLAPGTGGYMNEGNRYDPEYIESFYGSQYSAHLATKHSYDPTGLFYCPSCVGAENYVEQPDGPLCRAK